MHEMATTAHTSWGKKTGRSLKKLVRVSFIPTQPNLIHQQTVSQLSNSVPLPISTKLRLCCPSTLTAELGKRIAANGASWITLHARHVNARRRRAGSADLSAVRYLKEALREAGDVKVVSNGNVGTWDHITKNREETGADGIMVGETLLENPWFVCLLSLFAPLNCLKHDRTDWISFSYSLFENVTPDPVLISLEYLDICRRYPGTAMLVNIRTHIRHFFEYQW